jgi:hypothetical protein
MLVSTFQYIGFFKKAKAILGYFFRHFAQGCCFWVFRAFFGKYFFPWCKIIGLFWRGKVEWIYLDSPEAGFAGNKRLASRFFVLQKT